MKRIVSIITVVTLFSVSLHNINWAATAKLGKELVVPFLSTLLLEKSPPLIVYITDTGLYSAAYDGSTRTRLSPAFTPGDTYLDIYVSPDRQWVAVLAMLYGDVRFELYLVSTRGGKFVKISQLSNDFNEIVSYSIEWSPNSRALVYLADDSQDDNTEVFMVTINNDGSLSLPKKVNSPIGSGGNIYLTSVSWSFDGAFLAYKVNNRATGRVLGVNTHEVGSLEGEPGFSVRVSKPSASPSTNTGTRFAWSPKENKLVYQGNIAGRSDTSELFWVYASEEHSMYDANERVVSALAPGQGTWTFRWSDDGRYILYSTAVPGAFISIKAYDDDAGNPNSVKLVDLFNGPELYAWIPGSNRAAIFHYTGVGTTHQLTTINADGSSRLDFPAQDTRLSFSVAHDGKHIAAVQRNLPGIASQLLFINPYTGAVEGNLNFIDQDLDGIFNSNWSPGSRHLFYTSFEPITLITRLYTSNVPGGEPLLLTETTKYLYDTLWSPEGNHLCYVELRRDGLSSNLYCVDHMEGSKVNLTQDSDDQQIRFDFDGKFERRS